MTMTDPIADLLTRIRNAQQAGHPNLQLSTSKEKLAICAILEKEGYVRGFSKIEKTPRGLIEIELKYDREGVGAIKGIKRSSKPGRRVYVGSDSIPNVQSGLGVAILSTSKGVLAGHTARERKLGGELLCTVW
ncbi:MAG: small subunit ribosomal protein S8 [Myxococcota bacterium]|jgi:small subunit ribosomal protein S8